MDADGAVAFAYAMASISHENSTVLGVKNKQALFSYFIYLFLIPHHEHQLQNTATKKSSGRRRTARTPLC